MAVQFYPQTVDTTQFQALLRGGEVTPEFDREYPFYPLNSPGMPLPGPTFIATAAEMDNCSLVFDGKLKTDRRLVSCGPALTYLYRRALYDSHFSMRVRLKAAMRDANMLPGHLMHQNLMAQRGGPRRASIMVVYKCPTYDELARRMHLSSDTASVFMTAVGMAGVNDTGSWYVTSVVKWPLIDQQSASIPAFHKADNAILLEQELRLVAPDYILCLGSEAVKAVLGDKQTVRAMLGRVADRVINLTATGCQSMFKTAKVMVAESPSAVAAVPEKMNDFCAAVGNFVKLTRGVEVGKQEQGLRHINVYKQRQLRQIIDEIRADTNPWRRVIAVDGEWEGEYPTEDGAYLRTIQFSTAHKEGITVVLRHQNGAPAFRPTIDAAITELRRLLLPDEEAGWLPRIGGHFLRADLPWLIHAGLDVRSGYAPPADLSLMRHEGGFDTILQAHAVDETSLFNLTELTVKLTDAPAYDLKVREAVTARCTELDISKDQLEGYGFLPAWLLHPEPHEPEWGYNYASLDVDCCRRICMRHIEPGGLLDKDVFGNSSWEAYYKSHQASLGVLEMEMNGISVDHARVDKLTLLFMDVHNRLLQAFREQIAWPKFNPGSPQHKIEFLFGTKYSTKLNKATGERISVRPEGAMSLGFTPIKTTGKKTKPWEKVVSKNEEAIHNPSTDKETLGIFGYENKLVMLLRDIVFIAQALKGVLRSPDVNSRGEFVRNKSGHFVYQKGLARLAHKDGKVRTRLRQTMETGRASSSRPNLQAISSRREADYKRILGWWETNKQTGDKQAKGAYVEILGEPCYAHPIRSILRASPGHVLVEADYIGAELAGIAWLSGDTKMIDHVRRNSLPEDHPDYYDIHSNQAVKAFHLDCAPTKQGLRDIGKPQLRVAAKNVVFGVPYGRGPAAISRQCQEEGVTVTADECQLIIDSYFEQYPATAPFLESCEQRTQNPRWMAGSYGRYRRFAVTRNATVESDQKRQGRNFTIQNIVADGVWTAIYNFCQYRQNPDCVPFRLLMQIHDALLFEVQVEHLPRFYIDIKDDNGNIVKPSILRECMIDRVPIWPRTLENRPMQICKPYHFGIDTKLQLNWGEKISKEEAERAGIPLELL